MSTIKGVDVSSYQGTIDWAKAWADGIRFAILKVIRKDLTPDQQFERNWSGCTEAGVPVQGVYHYSYATNTAKAKSDAGKVLEILNGRKPMVWLDVEDSSQKNLGQELIRIINEYGAVITAAGCQFGVYTGLSFYQSYMKLYAGQLSCPFWIARYPSERTMRIGDDPSDSYRPSIVHEMYGWQYSSKGRVSGIHGDVDLNELYVAVEAGNVREEAAEAGKAADSYTVKSGDTLSEIAQAYHTTVDAILADNPRITNRDLIYVGQRIRIK